MAEIGTSPAALRELFQQIKDPANVVDGEGDVQLYNDNYATAPWNNQVFPHFFPLPL